MVEGAARGRRTPFVGALTDAAMDHQDLNLRVENGVKPPYSICSATVVLKRQRVSR